MNKIYGIFAIAAAVLCVSGCQKTSTFFGGRRNAIKANVVVNQTKAAADDALPGKFVSERVVSSADGFELIETVYENETLPCGQSTKGSVVTSASINKFNMMVYAEGEWFDNTIADGEPGSRTDKNAAGLYFEALSKKSGSTWSLEKTNGPAREGTDDHAGELYWLNNVPMTFWSYNMVKPTRTAADKVTFSYTVKSDVSLQEDLLFAFSKESREYHDSGEQYGNLKSQSSTSGASGDNVNVHFYHALSAVQFLQSTDLEGYRISGIEIRNVNKTSSCVVTGTDDVPVAGVTSNLSFAHTPSGIASFSQTYDAGDLADGGSLKAPADAATNGNFKPGDGKTFLMIPQTLGDTGTHAPDAALKVTFTNTTVAGSGKTTSPVFDLPSTTWEAGKYYVYKVDLAGAVKVSIDENCTETQKEYVRFQNTSNVNEYIRAAVVANWYDADGKIVAPWTGSITPGTGWTQSGGFYYYGSPVATGACTESLISNFAKPTGGPSGTHFEMTILVQAVASDEETSCEAAFSAS